MERHKYGQMDDRHPSAVAECGCLINQVLLDPDDPLFALAVTALEHTALALIDIKLRQLVVIVSVALVLGLVFHLNFGPLPLS